MVGVRARTSRPTDGATGRHWRSVGLRTRSALAFALAAFAVSFVLATTSFSMSRSQVLQERLERSRQQTYADARLARSSLRAPSPDVTALLDALALRPGSAALIGYDQQWFASQLGLSVGDLPPSLVRLVAEGRSGHQRTRTRDGTLVLVVGVPLAAVDAEYFEVFDWSDLERSLDSLRRSLVLGVVAATLFGAAAGVIWTSRLLRPLRPVADAAERIAAGHLETRLQPQRNRDLQRLADAFNEMAASLQERIAREARFSADVTHELRSPLAAMTAAVDVIQRRRSELTPAVADTIDVLAEKLTGFKESVLELLEIARMDAGTAELQLEYFDLCRLLRRVLEIHGHPEVPVQLADGAPAHIVGDRRRLAQVFENLVANARSYASGCRSITITAADGHVRVHLDDEGPGVPPEERETIFERFSRGSVGRNAGPTSGSGLGLALAREHVALHGGRIWVEDAPGRGARFVVELPLRDPSELP